MRIARRLSRGRALVGKRLQDVAVRHLPATALGQHPVQLPPELLQPPDPGADRRQVRGGDLVDLAAIPFRLLAQVEQGPDVRKVKLQSEAFLATDKSSAWC